MCRRLQPLLLLLLLCLFLSVSAGTVESTSSRLRRASTAAQPLPSPRPVIGVLALPCGSLSACQSTTQPYFPASYVKVVESSGARVLPLLYNSSKPTLLSQLSSIHAVLLTGGGASLLPGSPYRAAIETILAYAVQANGAGDPFPVWATCMGAEAVMDVFASKAILTSFDAENLPLPLTFTSQANASRLFNSSRYGQRAVDIQHSLATLPISMNNHEKGVSPAAFAADTKLPSLFLLLATSMDRQGKEFVAVAEGRDWPVFVTQFHPEKPVFEWWLKEDIPHVGEAVAATQYLMQVFMDHVRLSTRVWPEGAANRQLIYSHTAIFLDGEFEQVYVF